MIILINLRFKIKGDMPSSNQEYQEILIWLRKIKQHSKTNISVRLNRRILGRKIVST